MLTGPLARFDQRLRDATPGVSAMMKTSVECLRATWPLLRLGEVGRAHYKSEKPLTPEA